MITTGLIWMICLLFQKHKLTISAIVLAAITVCGFIGNDWEFLYRNTQKLISSATEYSNVDCLYIYDTRWMVQPSFLEAMNYASITLVRSANIDMIKELEINNDDKLAVILAGPTFEETKDKIYEAFPNLHTAKELGGHSLGKTYIFE